MKPLKGPLLFNLSARWGWEVTATPRPVCRRERDPVPIVQEGFISIRGTTFLFFRRVQTSSNQERRFMICKGKGKVLPITGHVGPEVE